MMRQTILPFGHSLTDSSANVFTIRFDDGGRLITACSAQSEMSRDELDRSINQRLVATIPSYSATPLEYGWKGTAWLNSSLLPRVLAVEDGLLAVQACNGRGLGLNTIIGREIVEMLTSAGGEAPGIPVERPRRVRGYALARHVPGLIMAGAALGRNVYKAAARVVGR
jgi:glycine/D-amino acid oxidase-like deaminating enzyme